MAREKFRFKVIVETEVEIDLDSAYWGTKEMLEEWSNYFNPIDGVQDIAEYAARMAALYPDGNHDGIGKLVRHWNRKTAGKGDVVFDIISEDEEIEFLDP